MQAIYIILLSVGASLICAMLRTQRPEVAAMVSIAVGIGALMLTGQSLSEEMGDFRRLFDIASVQSDGISVVLKAAGITILGELGVQICMDAGESALAGRIQLACRIVMLSMSMPFVMNIVNSVLTLSGGY